MKWKNYIVGLVDISGQSSKLDELGTLWWKLQDSDTLLEDESKRMTELANETYGEVEHFRKRFTCYFDNSEKSILKNSKRDILLPAEQAVVTKIATNIYKLRSFSDLVVFFAPFDAKDELLTRVRIAAMLSAYACVSILESKAGTFFRGGIE